MAAGDATVTVATFNMHLGVDGWGRPFDVVAACDGLGADLLVLQESWTPDGGGPSTARRVADDLGYTLVEEVALAHGRLFDAVPTDSSRWSPRLGLLRAKVHRLDHRRDRRLDDGRDGHGARDGHGGSARGRRQRTSTQGSWGVALLARIPVRGVAVVGLGHLRRDPARRVVLRCECDLGDTSLAVFGTHMSHLTHWSPAQYRRLAALLPSPDLPAVLLGDMNLWGPPVSRFFPTWRRAVIGRTWPSPRPHSQLDHVLVSAALTVVDARIAGDVGSDHRPVVVTLARAAATAGAARGVTG